MKDIDYTEIPDELWEKVEPLLIRFKRKRSGGSPAIPLRSIFNGIVYKLKAGCQWSMIPRCYGSKSTLHEHYQRWVRAGVFKEVMEILAAEFESQVGFDLKWQSMDGSLAQAPVREKNSVPEGLGDNPTDRGRSGSKTHLHVEGQGNPLGVIVVGANIHDSRLVSLTLEKSIFVVQSGNEEDRSDNLCLDKGYDYERVRQEIAGHGLVAYIRSRGEEVSDKAHPARHWVVERTFAWLKGFRTIRTRYCQRLQNYLAMVHLACAIILFRKLYN